jgi:Domain of unknown function (DUF222)
MDEHYPTEAERLERRRCIEALASEITELAGHLNAANYRFLKLIAEFDRCEGWSGDGATHSCAHWLNWKCGIAMGAAREKVRTARALEHLPRISAAMERGGLSYSNSSGARHPHRSQHRAHALGCRRQDGLQHRDRGAREPGAAGASGKRFRGNVPSGS